MSLTHLELFDQVGDYPRPFNRDDEEDEDYDEGEDDEDRIPKIRIGICAMSKKVNLNLPSIMPKLRCESHASRVQTKLLAKTNTLFLTNWVTNHTLSSSSACGHDDPQICGQKKIFLIVF